MRIDKFLKVSRLIKRRTVASEACSGGRVKIGDKVVKPGAEVKVGDIIEIGFGEKMVRAEVLSLNEHATKENAATMFKILEDK